VSFNLNFSNLKTKVNNQGLRQDALDLSLSTLSTSLNTHLTSTGEAHPANTIGLASITGLSSSDVQAALAEILLKLNAHLDSSSAHRALDIQADPLSTINQANVQDLLQGLEQLQISNFNTIQARIDALAASDIAVASPVGRAFTNTQNAIDNFNVDITSLKDQSSDHGALITQMLTTLLNTTNDLSTVNNLRTGTVGFTGFIFPTSAPSQPQLGSAYFTVTDKKLHIYDGSGFVTTQLA
jgi:hypothetical protein